MKKRLDELIDQCLQGHATADDRRELSDLISKGENRAEAKASLLRAYEENKDRVALPADARDGVLAAIYRFTSPRRRERRLPRIRMAVAASIVVLLSLGVYVYIHQQSSVGSSESIQVVDIEPGGNKAVLTLADGRSILLDEQQDGIVMDTGIRYRDGTPVAEGWEEEVICNQWMTITTPPGGQYAITLPDGSQVWMNAASSLRYPHKFANGERVVELEGEGYFEIAHRSGQPFLVKTAGQTVQVLGTHFNVNAYANERETRTTLVEGRIKIMGSSTAEEAILRPGEQSIVSGETIRKTEVDVSKAVAWREGRFDFNGKNLEQVMRELARWYAIEVVYEGRIPVIEFWGGVYRNQNLGTVLEILETNDLDYRLESDRKLVIFQSK